MLKIENYEVTGWKHAIRGMRNPMNSWDKSDSEWLEPGESYDLKAKKQTDIPNIGIIGPNDLNLMLKLRNAGTDHRKFMRMLVIYLDITAPLYWWKEFDTYKVGTVANSCSTMHKIAEKEFIWEDFSIEHLLNFGMWGIEFTAADASYTPAKVMSCVIAALNGARERYLQFTSRGPEWAHQAKQAWWQMIQLLPSSYNQKRTVMLNYEVLANLYESRRHHKLDEWHTLCDWAKSLPYSELITG